MRSKEPLRTGVEYEGVLRDGTRVLFRTIQPDDKENLVRGFEQLSETSRYRRFFRKIDNLSDEQLVYLTEIDFENHYAWIATLPDLERSPGVAVARWIRIPREPEVAECAITVIDAYQNQGIGTALLWLLARSAVEEGVKALRVWVQGENAPVLGMLGDFGVVPKAWEAGISEVDIPLPADIEELENTPAKILLRAVAAGELAVRAESSDPKRTGTRFVGPRRSREDGAPDRT